VQSNNETISKKSFHVVSDEPVGVYGLNYAQMTADAFIVLPTPALGREYFVMSYPSNSVNPSQYSIVAVHDNTKIIMTHTTETIENATSPQTIILNEGEV